MFCSTFDLMHIREAYQDIRTALSGLYESREASVMADMVMEEITGWNRSARLVHFDHEMNEEQLTTMENCKKELLNGRPIQYVLGHAWFCDMRFRVDERALIPRPETAELIHLIKSLYQDMPIRNHYTIRALDIGTGSGCIAISLKKYFPEWEVWSLDKSQAALELAKQNAVLLDAAVHFEAYDILNDSRSTNWKSFDLIVSNPPYIPAAESRQMAKHVLEHEPHLALFTTNENPLEFYEAILDFGDLHLLRGGMMFFETHMDYAEDVAKLMEEHDFTEVTIHKDMQGKDRMVYGTRGGSSL